MRFWRASGAAVGAASAALAVFGTPLTALWLGLGAILLLRGRRTAAIPLLLAPPTALLEYPLRIEPLAARVAEGGPGALGIRDLASVWILHLGVAIGGALSGFPEVAGETAGLLIPGGGTQVLRSSFPAGAAEVRATIGRWEEELRGGTGDATLFRPRRLPISRRGQLRHALALDPITLSGSAVRQGERWRLEVVGRVPIDYPARARLELLRTPTGPITVHEGLFDALERRGWLFPYTAEWRWVEWVDDPS